MQPLPLARLRPTQGSSHADERSIIEAILIVEGRARRRLAASCVLRPGRPAISDLERRSVFPGLCDAHLHLEKYARAVDMIDCETSTRQECLERVRRRALSARPGEWILGHGWNQNTWSGHGSADELDSVADGRPAYLTAVLHAAGSTMPPADRRELIQVRQIQRGVIVRSDRGSIDESCSKPPWRLWRIASPSLLPQQVAEQLRRAQTSCGEDHRRSRFRRRPLPAAPCRSYAQGAPVMHVESLPVELLEEAVALGLQSGFGDEWIRIGHVKIFADGALGPRTAAMLRAYDGEPENLGMLLIDREGILEAGIAAARSGLPLAIHAIGDRANHEVIEGLASLRRYEREHGLPELRHRIEHVQLLHPDDVPRLAELGLVASMQPIHATSDMTMAERYWGGRNRFAYAWRSQLQHGARLAFGSDAPVESPNPFLGLHAAVTRRRVDGSPSGEGWIPEERLRLEDALRGFTSGPAEVAGFDGRLGRLDVGSQPT
jgi:predicted amidohydrolase YtcJ